MYPSATDVATWLGRNDPDAIRRAHAVLPEVQAMVRAYTRGRGFGGPDADPEPVDEIAAVIVSVTARVITNPSGLQQTTITGPFTETTAGWQGFTLLERVVLDRYRRKAA